MEIKMNEVNKNRIMGQSIDRVVSDSSPPHRVLVQDLQGTEPELAAITVRTPRGQGPECCRMPWDKGEKYSANGKNQTNG
jgi:hypothetical protein